MSEQLKDALNTLTSTFQSLHLVARGLIVDAQEVADALKTATPDTAEYVALQALAEYNPVQQTSKSIKKVSQEET